MAEIKRVHVWSFVKIAVIFGLIFGLVWGILTSVYMSQLASNIASNSENAQIATIAQQMGTTVDALAANYSSGAKTTWLIATLMSVVVTFISSLITALVYNLIAKWWGGIKIDLEK